MLSKYDLTPLNNGELIKKLQQYPKDADVMIEIYDLCNHHINYDKEKNIIFFG